MAKRPNAATVEPEAEADDEGGQPKKKLPLKAVIMAVTVCLVLGGAGTAGYLLLAHKKEKSEDTAQPPKVAFLELPDVVVNLANPGGDRAQYLRVKIVLELPDAAMTPQIQPLMPRVMDAFQTYVREMRATDLDGSAGLYRLREELTRRINAAVEPARVNAVLFKELLVQ